MEEKTRWLELLKLRSSSKPREYAVSEVDVVKLLNEPMPEDYRLTLLVCFHSGYRITEAVKLLTTMPEGCSHAGLYPLLFGMAKRKEEIRAYLPAFGSGIEAMSRS